MKKVSWIENAYKSTDVHWAKSQTKIMEMLNQVGITQIRFTAMDDRFILEFMAQLDERSIPKAVRIIVPLRTLPTDEPSKRNKELNIIYRILLNHLKAKFIAVGNGITEFEQEFMSHLVITDKTGRSTTMGEALLPQYTQNLADGTMPQFRLGEGN
jgi:hypothetical protein